MFQRTSLLRFYRRNFIKVGNKFKLEGQEGNEERGCIRSPNEADAAVGLLDLARNKDFKLIFSDRHKYLDRFGIDYQTRKERENYQQEFQSD